MNHQGNQWQKGTNSSRSAEQILQTVSNELQNLHDGLIAQLSEEVLWLRTEKARLQTEVEALRQQQHALQTQRFEALSHQQMAQQQIWAKQLAQVIANHLQALIVERLSEMASASTAKRAISISGNGTDETAQRLLSSFDASFTNTFKTLQRELDSYESSLSQQLNRMHTLEQQGATILEALIERLREQLQVEVATARSPIGSPIPSNGHPTSDTAYEAAPPVSPQEFRDSFIQPSEDPATSTSSTAQSNPLPLQFPATPVAPPPPVKRELSQFQVGLLLVLLSTLALSFHNVVVKIVGTPSVIFGWLGGGYEMGGFIKLGLGNALLILWLRMLIVLPLMVPVAMFLYPPVWRDIRRFTTSDDRRPLINVFISGVSLFLSQILIYIAIGRIGPGVAVTLLFMYPIVTVPLAWLLFRDRPTRLRWVVMGIILLGVFFTALPRISWGAIVTGGATGVIVAALSGVAFAFYLLFMQLGFKKLHPVPVSLIQFATIFVLSSIVLLMPLDLGVKVGDSSGLFVGGLVLGILTLVGYLANNFGVRLMGASLASIIASSGPAVTALLGLLVINDKLQFIQFLGIFLVTFGVGLLSWERTKQQASAKPANTPAK
ncbi:MAG TPA: EamA family transporter [Leptolyngbyaceae cyanobacterium M33_DOE_097]|uniref:EamA family transporter n=1 Tax=Oscillatoriales cyanobacterium SpSt-418 TaxID=2282169 RepID=A0A7C3KC66_9CYAN|nr:EamA family transporter [Leptolyngbyaceae cyanobacterium M33_DOE_097]